MVLWALASLPLTHKCHWPFISMRRLLFALLWFLYVRVKFKQRWVHPTFVGGEGWDHWWAEGENEKAEAEVPHRRVMTWSLKGNSQWFSTKGWRFSLQGTQTVLSANLFKWKSRVSSRFSIVSTCKRVQEIISAGFKLFGSQFENYIEKNYDFGHLWILYRKKCDNTGPRSTNKDFFFTSENELKVKWWWTDARWYFSICLLFLFLLHHEQEPNVKLKK